VRVLCLLTLGVSCSGKDPGESCTWEGSGFTAKHDCRMGSYCLRSFSCPNGTQVDLSQCVNQTCDPETPCPENHACIRYSDNVSYCVPENLCLEGEETSSEWRGVLPQNVFFNRRLFHIFRQGRCRYL